MTDNRLTSQLGDMMTINPFHPDALDPIGKAATEIIKGDIQGHVFHGNQWTSWGSAGAAPTSAPTGGRHDEAVAHLRKLQERAAADQGRGTRRNTDALGRRFTSGQAPYGSTLSGHVGLQNWHIEQEAKALADKIDGDRTKSVEQHLDEAREQVKTLRQNALQNSMFDNHSTAKGLSDRAAVLQAAIDQLSDKLGIKKSVGEIADWIAFAKGGPGSGPQDGHPFLGNQYTSGSGGGSHEESGLTPSGHRPLSTIASDIRRDLRSQGKKVPFGAVPYLDALESLHDIKDNYYQDSAHSVVAYLLSNLSTWRGETAKAIKAELKKISK